MVRETPELYESIVKPYIQSFPKERLQWHVDRFFGLCGSLAAYSFSSL